MQGPLGLNGRALREAEIETLEKLTDLSSLADVVDALSVIANAKGEHIEANWQDQPLARVWFKAAGRLGRLAESLRIG